MDLERALRDRPMFSTNLRWPSALASIEFCLSQLCHGHGKAAMYWRRRHTGIVGPTGAGEAAGRRIMRMQ